MQITDDARVPVYLVAGFLESGKTKFLNDTIGRSYFRIDGETLLIRCEQGEEEYDEKVLEYGNTRMITVNKPEDVTREWLMEQEIKYHPERVLFECNGMYPLSKLEQVRAPKGWGIVQKIVNVDGSTFDLYMANMKPLFMEMIRNADLVIFNRCTRDMPLASYRRNVKVVNQKTELIFEDGEGEIDNIFEDQMPYDLDAPVIKIEDMDYGIWYVDMMDHPKRYLGKTIEYRARVMKPKELKKDEFAAGRVAMTCCADDTTVIGYICKSPTAAKLQKGQWVSVRGTVQYEYIPLYRRKGLLIDADYVQTIEPLEDEMVYFNN